MAAARLEISERIDIQDMFALYCFLVDQGRADEWAALFTPDAVFDVPGFRRWQGHAGMRELVDMIYANSKGMWRHQLTNILAEAGEEPGTANIRMYGMVTDWEQEKLGSFNDYSARLRKIDGEWRIEEIVARPTRVTI